MADPSRSFARHVLFAAITLSLAATLGCAFWPQPAPELTMGIISPRNPQVLQQAYTPLKEYLEAEVGCRLKLDPVVNYNDGLERMRQKSWDLAFVTNQTYLESRVHGYKAMVMVTEKGKGSYHSILIVPQDSPIKEVADLKGKTVAFVSKKSASGFIYPMKILLDHQLSPATQMKVVFAGSASIIGNSLGRNGDGSRLSFDAGAIYDGFMNEDPETAKRLRVLATSEPIPHIPVVAAQRIVEDEAMFGRFREAFLAAGKKVPNAFQDKAVFFDGFVPAQESLYEKVTAIERQVSDYDRQHPISES